MDDSITVLQNVSFINYTTFFFIVEPITSPFIYDFFFKSGCCFSCFYAYFRLGEVELRLGLPRRKKGKKHSPLFFEKKIMKWVLNAQQVKYVIIPNLLFIMTTYQLIKRENTKHYSIIS